MVKNVKTRLNVINVAERMRQNIVDYKELIKCVKHSFNNKKYDKTKNTDHIGAQTTKNEILSCILENILNQLNPLV